MARFGLALSGGGFRATLYHLGVVRFLKDVGALEQVTDSVRVAGRVMAHRVMQRATIPLQAGQMM